jgi:capsular exopolysaccharide synthesis family protein
VSDAIGASSRQADRRDDEIYMGDVWKHVRRNRLLVLACVAVALIVGALYAFLTPPVYEGVTTVRVDETRTSFPVLEALRSFSAGSEVETEMEVLRGPGVVEDVVDSLGLQVTLANPREVPRGQIFTYVKAERSAPAGEYTLERQAEDRVAVVDRRNDARLGVFTATQPIRLRGLTLLLSPAAATHRDIRLDVVPFENAVPATRNALTIERPVREANIIAIRYRGTDRLLVRDVPNALTARFLARRQEARTIEARGMAKLLREQLDTLSRQLALAEGELRSFRELAQVVSLPTEANAQVTRLVDLQAERTTLDAERSALAALLAEVSAARQQPGGPSPYRRLIAFPTLLRNPAATEFLRALGPVEDQRSALLTRRTPEDPDVQALNARVAEIEEQLRSLAVTYIQGLTNQVSAIDVTLARFGEQLERIPAKEIQFARLQRRPRVLEEMFSLLQTRLKEAEIAQAVPDASVRVVDVATLPSRPSKPNKALILAMAAVIGLLVGLAAAIVRGYSDKTVRTRDDVQVTTGLPVLGLIPHIGRTARVNGGRPGRSAQPTGNGRVLGDGLVAADDSRTPVVEAYRALRTNLTFGQVERGARTLLFASPMTGDGKTTSAANAAIALANQGLRVLLVDADLRRGGLHSVFGLPRERGLSNVLDGSSTVSDVRDRVDIGAGVTLDVVTTGPLPPNPPELMGSAGMRTLLETARDQYDVVIFDSPPLNLVTDAAVLGARADGVLVVVRAGYTATTALAYAVEQLRNVRANVLGAVLNDIVWERDAKQYGLGSSRAYDTQRLKTS